MPTVYDIAACILEQTGPLDGMKLQKLVYYTQAWSLAWFDEALFHDRIEAWRHGPVSPALYSLHRGRRPSEPMSFSDIPTWRLSFLSASQRATISVVTKIYGDKHPLKLSDMTHEEEPWREARSGLGRDDSSREPITHDMMKKYYSSRSVEVVGQAYKDGKLTIQDVAHAWGVTTSDAVALLDARGYSRDLSKVALDEKGRKEILSKIRQDRLRRNNLPEVREDRVARNVIATQRLEGVDARPWIKSGE